MRWKAFETIITETLDFLVGPWRQPHQMLNAQVYDSHASIHDDATARKLGFQGGTIEGPTHFSQFAPLCASVWGESWFEAGCISAHYRNPSFAGEEVQAMLAKPEPGQRQCQIQMVKRDGTEILRGTASVGDGGLPTALDQRLTELKPLADPVILRDVKPGMKTQRQTVRMDFDQNMGELYPFSLRDKLKVITESSPLYLAEAGTGNPWGRAIIPIEMLSVLSFNMNQRKTGCRSGGLPWACSPTRRSSCCRGRFSSAKITNLSARWLPSAAAEEPKVFGFERRSSDRSLRRR